MTPFFQHILGYIGAIVLVIFSFYALLFHPFFFYGEVFFFLCTFLCFYGFLQKPIKQQTFWMKKNKLTLFSVEGTYTHSYLFNSLLQEQQEQLFVTLEIRFVKVQDENPYHQLKTLVFWNNHLIGHFQHPIGLFLRKHLETREHYFYTGIIIKTTSPHLYNVYISIPDAFS